MRIVVTGGAGYIGSHVVLDLLDAGHSLLVLDDLSTGDAANIFKERKSYSFVEADYTSPEALEALRDFKPEAAFHFAALKAAGLSMSEPHKYSEHNIRKSFHFIETLSLISCPYLIFSSSAAVYGEPLYLPLDEKHPCKPLNYYGFTKKLIEDNLLWFSKLGKLHSALLRYFNAAGYDLQGRIHSIEKDPNNLIPIIMEVCAGKRERLNIFGKDYETPDGTCIRDYIHVNDLSKAHLSAMEYLIKADQSLILNLGAERGYSVKEVLAASQKTCGQEIPHSYVERRAGDSAHLLASSQEAYKTLNWKAEHSGIEEILKSTWQLYEKKFAPKETSQN